MLTCCRTISLALTAMFAGCNSGYYRESLASHLPRDDGTMLSVECVSDVKHTVASISPTLQPQPQIAIVMDERKFIIDSTEVLLNDKLFAQIPLGVKKVRIEINKEGFTVTADGLPVNRHTGQF